MNEVREFSAHWWKDSEDGPYNCCVLMPDTGWSSVTFRSYTWRLLRRSMREFGIDPGRMREREVAISRESGIRDAVFDHHTVEAS